ncbi:5-oxoprolinase subunit PxpB [Oceanobacillus manasiensis]|uniref:5-oxoprolinase subunit PxpB n=1 Tax=Oceanobacillus manasiensis TaxID=586413 RepID=UPI0005A8F320|nr:5-oxoprolinase subunit PxpB [Oceanobacillus manasiensis]
MQHTMTAIGDGVIRVDFAGEVSPQMNQQIQRYCRLIQGKAIYGVTELVPGYHTITLYYEPFEVRYNELITKLEKLLASSIGENIQEKGRLLQIPVCYGGEQGPDLHKVAERHQMKEEEVVRLHQEPTYLVYLLGFLPGFPYLGGLSPELATPRLQEPRANTPAGSVGIADAQTGIYPFTSPGGWNIIGNTPIPLFDAEKKEHAFLFRPGDRVTFYEISEAEYNQLTLKDMQSDLLWEEVISIEKENRSEL